MGRPKKVVVPVAGIDGLPAVPVTAALPADVNEALESHRWTARLSRPQAIAEAVKFWAESKGLLAPARERLQAQADAGEITLPVVDEPTE